MEKFPIYDGSLLTKVKNLITGIADLPYYFYIFGRALLIALISVILPQTRKTLNGETILISGAASGVGRFVALLIARKTAKVTLVLWDINEAGLGQTAKECKDYGAIVYFHKVDLTNRQEISSVAQKVRQETGGVTILFNNAGIVYTEPFLTSDPDKEEAVIKTNLMSYMWVIREFLPQMVENGKGHIISTCSGLALTRCKNMSSYVASKYGLQGFIETLRLEMKRHPQQPSIKLSLVFPTCIKTPMTGGFQWTPRYNFRSLTLMEPEYVANEIIDGIEKELDEIMIPSLLRVVALLYRIFPTKLVDELETHLYKELTLLPPSKPTTTTQKNGSNNGKGSTNLKVPNNNL